MKKSLIAIAILSLSSTCFASEPGSYIGFSLGKSTTDSGVSGVTGTASLDEEGSPNKFFGGYDFGNNWSFEASYLDLGTIAEMSLNTGDTFTSDGVIFIALVDGVKFELDGSAITASAKYSAPVSNKLDLYGKVGIASYTLDMNLSAPAMTPVSDSTSGTDITVGVGGSFAVTDKVSAHLDYDTYNFESGDNRTNIFSFGISYSF